MDAHLLQSFVWEEKYRLCVSSLQTFLKLASKLKLAHTQKHKQTDGKAALRIRDAGSEAALHKVTREARGHEGRKQRISMPAGQTQGLRAKPEQASLHLLYPK